MMLLLLFIINIIVINSFILSNNKFIKNILKSTNAVDIDIFTKANNNNIQSIDLNNKLDDLFTTLTKKYQLSNKNILKDDNLLGNYNVSYVKPDNNNRRGNPAGGRFRDLPLFKINGIYQHLIQDLNQVIAINFITGKLFYFIPFSIILRGLVYPLTSSNIKDISNKNNVYLTNGTVEAEFEPPYLVFGKPGISTPGFVLSIGPKSNVILDTPYVDDKIRLGVGSRGSYFIFERTKDLQSYDYQNYLSNTIIKAKSVGKLFLGIGLSAFGVAVKLGIKNGLKSFGLISSLFGIFLILSRGGIID